MHLLVIYFKKDGVLYHISLWIISDDLENNTCFVHELQRIVMVYIKEICPRPKVFTILVTVVLGSTRIIRPFLNLHHHKSGSDVHATWAFFATSHGKSPCNGIGSTVKCKILHACLQSPANNQILMFHAVKNAPNYT